MEVSSSYGLKDELSRFLSRCPDLASVRELNSLALKGQLLIEEEVLNSVTGLFLHPSYTIPLLGCFRSIAVKIVAKAVHLLGMAGDLRSKSCGDTDEFKEDSIVKVVVNWGNAAGLIDNYVNSGRGLFLHEHACLAFSRSLELIPALGSVVNYFRFAPPPFERIMLPEYGGTLSTTTGKCYLSKVLRVAYRLLLAKPEKFAVFWDWSCFINLLQKFTHLKRDDNVLDIIWCGAQILSVVFEKRDRADANLGLSAKEAYEYLLRWQEFCQDISLEKAGWFLEPFDLGGRDSVDGTVGLSEADSHRAFGCSTSIFDTKSLLEVESFEDQRLPTGTAMSYRSPFVLTSAMKKSNEMIRLAVSQKWPVLLYGAAGVGKTKLISQLAAERGAQVLAIHVDDQIDGKTLIGSYVCTEQPGEFRWQPGSLTQAVLNGFWVVFEGIDKAPSDVQSILLPLLEGVASYSTGRGEAIKVAEGFQLFSTVSSSKLETSRSKAWRSISGLWRRVFIQSPSDEDLVNIVNARYPELEPLAEKLIETFVKVNQLAKVLVGPSASSSSMSRFSLRDLLKWCNRIAALGYIYDRNGVASNVCYSIFREAVEVFASFTTTMDNRLAFAKEIAKTWAVPSSDAETLYPVNKPVIQELHSELRVGRITLPRSKKPFQYERKPFVELRSSIHTLERIACSVKLKEPVLLVGETGTGKTTLVQSLALRLGQKLTVLNLSQQSDIADLLGGFKPMNAQFLCIPLYKEFENLFSNTFSLKGNEDYLVRLKKFVNDKNWKKLMNGFEKGVRKIIEIGSSNLGSGSKRKRPVSEELLKAWEMFALKLKSASSQINGTGGMIFSFVEGAFVTALKNGEWILLDEVNLAPPEILQRITGVLEEDDSSLCLAERGDADYIHRHPNFRLFACMNPATDAGKRDLPNSLRSRFTEYFVDDILDDDDLILFVTQFMDDAHSNVELLMKIVRFYKAAKKESEERLQDGSNQKPQYSLRSLYRALEYTKKGRTKFGFRRSLYDGFCIFFLTLLDQHGAEIMHHMIKSYLWGQEKDPPSISFDEYLKARGDLQGGGSLHSDDFLKNYVITKSVKNHIVNLARAIFVGRYPILLQGPTSSGKTSLVQYLAAATGNEFVRINNHEHTDLQEYLGSYITDSKGRLSFHEGVLVRAVRHGHWIVLDELNLAPSDVLEALNRLLDDNRELFVPELRETIRAHPNFMLFATQNPPTFYGGRKILSRAFRNRFVEIHVDEIPEVELSTILERRCKIPESYAKKMVEVMKELQLHRQSSKVFAGKHGYITPRDLFRWADRFRKFGKSYEDLARDGYFLLAERLRDKSEKTVVQEVLARKLLHNLFEKDPAGRDKFLNLCKYSEVPQSRGNVIWTESMKRLYFLIERCYQMREPVLLVGETGGGKTTVCQLLSNVLGAKLHILNCHQYTETSDFLGGFYPVRDRSKIGSEFKKLCEQIVVSRVIIHFPDDAMISSDIGAAASAIDRIAEIINSYKQGLVSHPDVTLEELDRIEQLNLDLVRLYQRWQTIFVWQDGPLVQAMREGDLFLVDEISLADDSVLERLNSVLEPERKLSLAERGGSDLETITAHSNFFLLATMNPGGDYGKKELSPALRNRFTEIWVPSVEDLNDLKNIASQRISDPGLCIAEPMISFWEWFNQLQIGRTLTVRDLLSWIDFINATEKKLQPAEALLHGAFLILLDGLSLGSGISRKEAEDLREKCMYYLQDSLKVDNSHDVISNLMAKEKFGWGCLETSTDTSSSDDMQIDDLFGIEPFYIPRGANSIEVEEFQLKAPTTRRNALRVLRAMQLPKPVLLEGSPGVGKTSLIVALGKFSGHSVVRINLSEQTDIMDLLGSDLPVESGDGLQFAWSDGILLQALKKGSWVLLDELNLAPQSVLEGLNAILDHRAEVFIPELNTTFKCPSTFRVFACQNPSSQGGGRKGLPKSFLNRFTKVYVDELVEDDYLCICKTIYPSIPESLLSKLISFNRKLHEDTMLHHKFAQDGSPWEFNLRDVTRSCQIIEGAPESLKPHCFLNTVYVQRMRTEVDRKLVVQLFVDVFGFQPFLNPFPRVQLNRQFLVVGNTNIERNSDRSFKVYNNDLNILPGMRHSLEAAALCVQHQWLCILVGPPSSGKTSLVRLLSQLTGNVLNEINLSYGSDISELLGCFEQYDALRHYQYAVTQVERYVKEISCLQLESLGNGFSKRRKELVSKWFTFSSAIGIIPKTIPPSKIDDSPLRALASVSSLLEIIDLLMLDRVENELPLSWSCMELKRTRDVVLKLQDDYQRTSFSARFEWVVGTLVKAIENGEWIVLENANLCNPTVLDRINSLVEPHGSITINECGSVDGKPLVLQPHPQFRIFLTVDPSYGEVSRAMRNRGVEIYIMQPHWLLSYGRSEGFDHNELKNVKRFLVMSGMPLSTYVDSMSEAHIYARVEGLHLGVQITNLELARWLQLFQRLLMSGYRPLWSLHTSWEHTYLSSLGEAEGKDIVTHVLTTYLSRAELYKSEVSGLSLCLPGGWPTPLKLTDYVCYSKEASARQNFMYLEFLGAAVAAYSGSSQRPADQMSCASEGIKSYLVDMKELQAMMFPNVSHHGEKVEIDLRIAEQKLLFAASWSIEQVTENDRDLFFLWLDWFVSKLSCNFFTVIRDLFKEELEHPIWNCIVHCRQELLSHLQVNLDSHPIPMLSTEFTSMYLSNDAKKFECEALCRAIKCTSLLRSTLHQWHAEKVYKYSDKHRKFRPVLSSLQGVERKVLDVLVKSSSFEVDFQLYGDLLEDHTSFWNSIISSQFEISQISWRSLIKTAVKLRKLCATEVEHLKAEAKNLTSGTSWCLHPQKSLLWVHGGHPSLPSSADLYQKQLNLVHLSEKLWPRGRYSKIQGENACLMDMVVSSMPEVRSLAMEGVGMSSYMLINVHGDELQILQQLEEIYQLLWRKFHSETKALEAAVDTSHNLNMNKLSAACCVFSPDVLCRRAGIDSWQETLPIIDYTSLVMDMEILQELLQILMVDAERMELGLSGLSDRLKSRLNFSLNSSSRPPTDFIPHQKILWTLDAWDSVNGAKIKVTSFILEMWYNWHSSLWTLQSESVKKFLTIDNSEVLQPDILFQPLKMAVSNQILHSTSTVRHYPIYCLKLRAASRDLWRSRPPVNSVQSSLLSTARFLFQQIIHAHSKSFEGDKYMAIKSGLCNLQKNVATQDDLELLLSLLASSSHRGLASLVGSFIEPLLGELYLQCSATDILHSLGSAWLHVGGLRYQLLVTCDDLDPALKHSWKYQKSVEKMSLFEAESEVRKESEYLAGCLSLGELDGHRNNSLEKLHAECKRLKTKIVFRPDAKKFVKLKYECNDFLELVKKSVALIKDMKNLDVLQIDDQFRNWQWIHSRNDFESLYEFWKRIASPVYKTKSYDQETASRFVARLSGEYSVYADIVQPIEVAVYEMKLGLSLIYAQAMRGHFLRRVGQDDVEKVLEIVHSFMRFPRGVGSEAVSVKVNYEVAEFPSCDIDYPMNAKKIDADLLEKLVTMIGLDNSNVKVSPLQMKVAIHHNVLVRLTHSISEMQWMDNQSFMMLHKIYGKFASLWMEMKVIVKSREEHEAQQFKFRPRAFKIEDIIEVDISDLGSSLGNETLSEWNALLSEEDASEKPKEVNSVGEEWNSIQDSLLNSMVNLHNQIFGSMDLVRTSGTVEISDAEKKASFIDSYTLGVSMIRDFSGILSSNLDAELTPEHLFRICLEHDQHSNLSHKFVHSYNFYKDSNAPVMAKMVGPVTTLQDKIQSLSTEWDYHPALQKILDVIEMTLSIPLSTPLAKALSSLQFLLNRVRVLQDTVSKFPLSAEVDPIFHLVSAWQKLELESWPALLDEAQMRFNINASKLWFPLYSVLLHEYADDSREFNRSTMQGLEDFIQTSSVGEFRKRLQLLVAFYGQINTGIRRGCYLSCNTSTLKILYNTFGFYVQYLPTVSQHIQNLRKGIETELKELLKLCNWERPESYVSIENSKRARQKLKKLIVKYTDVLQQPVMLIINQSCLKQGTITSVPLGSEFQTDSFDWSKELRIVACDQALLKDKDGFSWLTNWKASALKKATVLKSSHGAPSPDTQSTLITYKEQSEQVFCAVEKICRTAMDCSDLWKDESKKLGKRRALSELQKSLEGFGLSKHRTTFFEDQQMTDQSDWWLLQPSYDIKHLLLGGGGLPSKDSLPFVCDLQTFSAESLLLEWETANQYYFKSISSIQVLQQICLNFHKDFTLEQVNRSRSFLGHLLAVQEEQRAAAYSFAQHVSRLGKALKLLENLSSSSIDAEGRSHCFCAQSQQATFNFMWQQKQIIDSLCSMLREELLLIKTVEGSHLNGCRFVSSQANRIHTCLAEFVPAFQNSKGLLDDFLLNRDEGVPSVVASLHPHVVSKKMELLVHGNFQLLKKFEEAVFSFRRENGDDWSLTDALLSNFDDLFGKVNLIEKDYECASQRRNMDKDACLEEGVDLKETFMGAITETYNHIMDVFRNVGSSHKANALPVESWGDITRWKSLFESHADNLQLTVIFNDVVNAINCAGKLMDHGSGGSHCSCDLVGMHMKDIYSLLDSILTCSGHLLRDFLVVHKMVSILTHALANIFASLYSKGFGHSTEDQQEESTDDKKQDVKGTGMGEGAGLHDVSDQITDEDQLLGTTEQRNDEQDDNAVPENNANAVEMEEDIESKLTDLSEDSGEEDDENEDGEEEQLDSAIGETGANSEVMDEKPIDKNDEENLKNAKENCEDGPAASDNDPNNRELRAKEESDAIPPTDDAAEPGSNELGNEDVSQEEDLDDTEGNENDMDIDKDGDSKEPIGPKADEPNQESEDVNMDDQEGADTTEETEEPGEANENIDDEENPTGDCQEKTEADDSGDGDDDVGDSKEEDTEMKSSEPGKNMFEQNNSESTGEVPNTDSEMQLNADIGLDLGEVAPESVESQWSSSTNAQNNLAPSRGLPNASDVSVTVPNSSMDGELREDRPQNQSNDSTTPAQKNQPNPCRNVGEALDRWKEKVKVTGDLRPDDVQNPEDMLDEDANEYGFTSEFDKGTAQTLGPATFDQMDHTMNGDDKPDDEGKTVEDDSFGEMEIEKQDTETRPRSTFPSVPQKQMEDLLEKHILKEQPEEGLEEIPGNIEGDRNLSENIVTMKKSYINDQTQKLDELNLDDEDLGKAQRLEEISCDTKDSAAILWRKYELLTTRLSQELAEQLRLVMEPTLASKLQGDYKTGKRINMKKVIPYIASQYRKDKIWLRRTRPNKRDYQVVVAVDDSRSMSESQCGDVATKALVTVCRAMSQLEVGELAVASFGTKGNIKLLHEFDQPFTGEAGVKMISSLTFKQENTIQDEPMVDLLKYVNNMLDDAVANARLSSGQNPLQQLVLIIADGRFHEKKNLKRCVRDVLNSKRMVAFLLLDSSEESIMDLEEISFQKNEIKRTKYLDSFPFPYYVVLRDIEALPRTLADLMRQWFELMQNARDW